MKYEPITIKDIAKALGLSNSTVSRALRDSHEISIETKKTVLEYAARMNYRPNPIALSLKERRTRSIGIIVSEIANSFFSQAINGIESIARERGYNVIITQTQESTEREADNILHLAARSVDGIILSLSSETKDLSHLTDVHQKGMPLVFFDRVTDEIQTHNVIANNYQGAYDATVHLIKSGYQQIAFIGSAEYLSITKERLAGYNDAHRDLKIPANGTMIRFCQHGGFLYDEVEDAVKSLVKGKKKPDAILACADKVTTNCLRYFNKNKIRVPEDIALVGFSNLDLTELLKPSLSVIRQPAFEIGQQAMELLLQLIESKRPVRTFERRSLPPQLIIRESSAKVVPVKAAAVKKVAKKV